MPEYLVHEARSRGLRKEYRSQRPLPANQDRGEGEDVGKYYRCANCNWICNIDRDQLDGFGDGTAYVAVPDPTYVPLDQSQNDPEVDPQLSVRLTLGGSVGTGYTIALLLGPDDEPVDPPPTTYRVAVSGGCPLCGTYNWRGDI